MKHTQNEYQKLSLVSIGKYNWKRIEFPAGSKDLEKFGQNNKTIALNILFVVHNTETIYRIQKKYTHNRKKQVILLMITDGSKWYYLAVSNLSALLEGKLSNHHGDFYCLNCFNSYSTENALKEHEVISNEHKSCRIEMPKRFEKILKCSPGEKSLKPPFAIYLDLKCLLKKKKNLVKSIPKNLTQRKKLSMSLGNVNKIFI